MLSDAASSFLNGMTDEAGFKKLLHENLRDAAISQGIPSAQHAYGNCYLKGTGGRNANQKDFKKAAYWHRCAAKQGYAPALNSLAISHELGHGVETDSIRSLCLYDYAANLGSRSAAENLCDIFATGKIGRETIPPNQNLSLHYYQMSLNNAAENSHKTAHDDFCGSNNNNAPTAKKSKISSALITY